MKKSLKTALKIAAGSSAALAAVSELAYECVLNVDFSNKIVTKFNLQDKKMMDILLNHPVYTTAYEWFDAKNLEDTMIIDENGEKVFGNILINENADGNNTNKWAICVHGYGGEPRAEAPFAKHFYENGYNILFPHMRAHSSDQHKYCSMGYYDKDIVIAWINYLVNEYPECQIVMHGVSMGSSAVMMATGEDLPSNVKCAVADCGYTSCWDEFAYEMKNAFHLPVYPLLPAVNAVSKLRGNFDFKKADAKSAVAKSKTPTLFIHGTDDEFVPYRMLDEVYGDCTAEKEKLSVPGAVHTACVAIDPEGYFSKTDSFIAKYVF